jgi:hypothetical protein
MSNPSLWNFIAGVCAGFLGTIGLFLFCIWVLDEESKGRFMGKIDNPHTLANMSDFHEQMKKPRAPKKPKKKWREWMKAHYLTMMNRLWI